MDEAVVYKFETSERLSPNPIHFIRLPMIGELISITTHMWTVVAVLHGCSVPNNPVAEVYVAPASSYYKAPIPNNLATSS